MAKEEKTYTDSIKELQVILDKIESGDLDVDILTQEVKKASLLIKSCKDKLYKTNEEIVKILGKME